MKNLGVKIVGSEKPGSEKHGSEKHEWTCLVVKGTVVNMFGSEIHYTNNQLLITNNIQVGRSFR